jgi:hypothetical protein
MNASAHTGAGTDSAVPGRRIFHMTFILQEIGLFVTKNRRDHR